MRTIGAFIIVLMLFPSFQLQKKLKNENNPADPQENGFRFHKPVIKYPALTTDTKKSNIDTSNLKQSSWYADAMKNIQESEYEIKPVVKTNEFASPNRQQNLRAFYTADKFILEPEVDDNWKLELTLKGIYSGKKKIYSPQDDAYAVTEKNKIQFNHNNEFTVEYINSKEGVRQNFIINKQPDNNSSTLRIKLQANPGWFINKVHAKEIHFAKATGDRIEKKITYNDLKVWDANNKELDASFSVNNNEISIDVTTADAVYPINIDPISTTPAAIVESNQATAYMGISVASAGDVNGDGYSDVIVGAYFYDNGNINEGAAFVYHGSASGISTTAAALVESNQANAILGYSVACAGDVNGDGYSDIIAGVPFYDNGQTDEGAAFVYHGSASGIITSVAAIVECNQADADMGWSVASAGDVNGDGYSDVIVGVELYDNGQTNEGAAFVYHGSATGINTTVAAIVESNQASALMGISVASAGDVNGDGYSDVIVGAYFYDNGQSDEGAAFVYHGSASGISTTAATIVESNQVSAFMGISVASAGDVNGDGYSDVIVGAFQYDNGQTDEGAALIYHGSASGISTTAAAIVESNQAGALMGISVASAGDINGDGYSDVIVGAYQYDNGQNDEGAAFVYLGSSSSINTTATATVESNQINAQMGISVASAGDVNGDGYSDVIAGAWLFDNGEIDEGAAFVYHGSPDGLSASPVNTPDDADQALAVFGKSVAAAGDVNGDGYSDVIIGANGYDGGANLQEGRAFVYHGSATGLSATPNTILDDANQTDAYFGFSVAAAGDVNGDGYSDVIIGTPLFDEGANTDEGRAFVYHGSAAGLSVTPNSILDDADKPNALFGTCVASAGDVDGDGYGDVIIGANGYEDGANTGEGRTFVYHGSSSGLSATPNSTQGDADQPIAQFGISVASAGDVNGDGYSDVIIGAYRYDNGANTDEGRAFVYHGSATGLSATPNSTPDDADQASAFFGRSVSSAGDINGDGYCDVIIGAVGYDDGANTDEGRAFVYYGSASGLSATPNSTPDDADQADAAFGFSVAGAGDVNGDGYCDVIIGALGYDDGANNLEGRAFVYYGSASGLSATPNSTPDDADQADARLGTSVASAGDINGDGYSDVIIGASNYDDVLNTDEGRAFVYYGNNTGGLRNNLRLYNSDLVTPIQQSNMADPNLFGAGLFAKSFLGRQKGRLVWQTVKNGQPFTGSPITNSTLYTAQTAIDSIIDLTGKELKHQIAKQTPTKATYIRARVKYDKVTAITGQVYGPWRYPEGFLRGRRDAGAVALPVKFISFNALKQDQSALLKWITVDEEPGVKFEVQHSTDGINFTTLAVINGKNQTRNEYEWLHTSPGKGNNFYRIKAVENQKQAFTTTRKLNFSQVTGISIYPNPAVIGQPLIIRNASITSGQLIKISFINSTGQLVWQKEMQSAVDGSVTLNIPDIPSGAYLLLVQSGKWNDNKKIIIAGR